MAGTEVAEVGVAAGGTTSTSWISCAGAPRAEPDRAALEGSPLHPLGSSGSPASESSSAASHISPSAPVTGLAHVALTWEAVGLGLGLPNGESAGIEALAGAVLRASFGPGRLRAVGAVVPLIGALQTGRFAAYAPEHAGRSGPRAGAALVTTGLPRAARRRGPGSGGLRCLLAHRGPLPVHPFR